MSEDSWPKLAASTGIAAAVFLILSVVFGPSDSPPGFNDSAAEVQSFVQENRSEVQAALTFQFAALVSFVWFLGAVYYRLRPAEPSARLSATALAGGVVLAVGGLVGSVATGAAAYHVDTLGSESVLALWDLSVFGYMFFLVGLTVLAGSAGVLAMRAGALPGGLGAYSLLVALAAFVVGLVGSFSETGAFSPSDGALGFIVFLGFIVWLLAMGITLVRQPRAAAGGSSA